MAPVIRRPYQDVITITTATEQDAPLAPMHWNATLSPLGATPAAGPPAPRVVRHAPDFASFFAQWCDEMAPQWRRQHRMGVDAIAQAHLLPAFGAMPLDTITRADVLAFRAALAKRPGLQNKPLSAASIRKVLAILTQFLAEAGDRFGFPSPAAAVKRPRSARADIAPFSLQEINLLCREIRADFRPYLTTRFFTGLRTGEINGLKWEHIDLDLGVIRVRDTFSAGLDEPQAKTPHSRRDVTILPPVREALLAQWRDGRRGCPYVFHSRLGHPIDAHNFANRIWYPLLKRLGLAKRRPYQTRHTTATLLLASGESPEWVARMMGHASTQMLFTVYSRYVPNLTRQDGSAINRLIQDWQLPRSAGTP